MTDIMIDMTRGKPYKRYEVHTCHYCNNQQYPNGKIIDPITDKLAKKMPDGSYKCGYCVNEDIRIYITEIAKCNGSWLWLTIIPCRKEFWTNFDKYILSLLRMLCYHFCYRMIKRT
jgi:hypothetical protein